MPVILSVGLEAVDTLEEQAADTLVEEVVDTPVWVAVDTLVQEVVDSLADHHIVALEVADMDVLVVVHHKVVRQGAGILVVVHSLLVHHSLSLVALGDLC